MGKFKQLQKSNNNKTRQDFLLTFFPDKQTPYEEKEVNGFILVKHIVNGDHLQFQVAIYTLEAFAKTQEYKQACSHLQSIKLSGMD